MNEVAEFEIKFLNRAFKIHVSFDQVHFLTFFRNSSSK